MLFGEKRPKWNKSAKISDNKNVDPSRMPNEIEIVIAFCFMIHLIVGYEKKNQFMLGGRL
ncbi:hypothetical protein K110096F8_17560 [Dielma fastidiosa]